MAINRLRQAVPVLCVVGLYLLALCLPALRETGGSGWASTSARWYWGFECLGYVPIVMVAIPWWANPCFFIGLILLGFGHRRGVFCCGVVGTLLAAGTVFMVLPQFTAWISGMGAEYDKPCPFGPGYVAWLMSMVGLACTALWPPITETPTANPLTWSSTL